MDFSRPYFDESDAEAAAQAVRSGWVVGGPRLEEFEQRFASLHGFEHGIGVSSWTAGAFLILHALGLKSGSEVVVPSLTFIASVNVIKHAGLSPVFADIDGRIWNIDPADAERKISQQTRVLMPVDQIGVPADMEEFRAMADRHGLFLLEDAACAVGSQYRGRPVGALADVAVFSLHARKVVTTGEGGMILCDDATLAKRLRQLRHQGMSLSDHERHQCSPTTFEDYPEIGYNFRITDIQAGIGLRQLDKLPAMLATRHAAASQYDRALAHHPWLKPQLIPEYCVPNRQSYMIELQPGAPMTRNQVMDSLHARGIPSRRGVMASHVEAPYRSMNADLPITERVAANSLLLPMHSGLGSTDVDAVVAALEDLT